MVLTQPALSPLQKTQYWDTHKYGYLKNRIWLMDIFSPKYFNPNRYWDTTRPISDGRNGEVWGV
jgi:hypothetical protein